jgi:mannosyltransferase
MYSLVAVLSTLASASFVLAFVHARPRHLWWLGVWLVLLLYTHSWALFLVAGMGLAWTWLWRRGRVEPRDGAMVAGGVAVAYAPWVPTLLSQAASTAAPWAERPTPLHLLAIPGALFGSTAAALLGLAALGALRRGRVPDAAGLLALIALSGALAAFASSQLQPAWAPRYAAVFFGPLLLALAAALARGPRWSWAALAGVAVLWLGSGPAPAKSNVRGVSQRMAPALRAGDLVVCTQPDQVPVLSRYLPPGLRYLTPLGPARDPGVTDWRDGVARLGAGRAERLLAPALDRLPPGRRVLFVVPLYRRRMSQAPWSRAVRSRTREWRSWIRRDAGLRLIGAAPPSTWRAPRTSVRAQLFAVR